VPFHRFLSYKELGAEIRQGNIFTDLVFLQFLGIFIVRNKPKVVALDLATTMILACAADIRLKAGVGLE